MFLWSVCCSLGDIFNIVQCFQICMLARSDGLQCCSSMPCWHQKMSFLYSGTQRLFSFLKWNRGITDAPILYIASRFIVQGYSPHKCIKCAYCVHSKRTKKSPTLAWSQLNPSPSLHCGPLLAQQLHSNTSALFAWMLCRFKQNSNKQEINSPLHSGPSESIRRSTRSRTCTHRDCCVARLLLIHWEPHIQ